MSSTDEQRHDSPSSLASAILAREDDRQVATPAPTIPTDQLVGIGEEVSWRDGLRLGGKATFAVLATLTALDELESATLAVLGPEIRDSLGISNGVLVFISASAGGFLVLGALPMGWLADRYRRSRIIGFSSLLFSLMVLISGAVTNAFQLFWARFGVGIAKSNQLPVYGSLLADAYPIGIRGRISSWIATAGRLSGTLSPALVGGIAALAGGTAGWRWAFVVLAVPGLIAALWAFRLPEPPRGQHEKLDVIGEVFEEERPVRISTEAAFSRLMQIDTIRLTVIAFAAMGFSLFTVPILANLFMEQEYGLGSFGRGAAGTVGGVFVLMAIPFVGRYYDRVYRENPARALRLIGLFVFPAAILTPLQYFMPNPVLFVALGVPQLVLMSMAFAMVGPIMQAVVPYRLRGLGAALGAIYIFFIGATGGALASGILVNAYGPKIAVIALTIPSTIIGGWLVVRSSKFIIDDLAMITAEIREELDEHERQQADAATIPAVQVNHIDFFYDQVQILFDVGFEVRKGEVLALLGTNGAGKSTILRVIAGLGTPARGVVRLNGRNVTYASPEERARMGLAVLPGGKGVFAELTVRQNLDIATFQFRHDPDDVSRRVTRVLDLAPELEDKLDTPAGDLSGGQQQLLAMASVLACEPEVLIIDELSLGLAPIAVERLVRLVGDLNAAGMTVIVVEQSLNVAATISDRALFLEKGHVRFEGATKDLLARDDLARAVFLGMEGG